MPLIKILQLCVTVIIVGVAVILGSLHLIGFINFNLIDFACFVVEFQIIAFGTTHF
jgi:hypothetical protein